MEKNELELDAQNPGQEEPIVDPEVEEEPQAEPQPEEGDPLDYIEDIEEMRAEAKKQRAIANRKPKEEPKLEPDKEPTSEPSKEPINTNEFVKKSDVYLANQKKGIRLATISNETDSDEVKQQKQDILDNWDEIKTYYSPRRGKDTPEDVLEDIRDAYVIFNNRRPPREEIDDSKKELIETKVAPTGTASKAKPKAKNPPNFKLPRGPEEWYE